MEEFILKFQNFLEQKTKSCNCVEVRAWSIWLDLLQEFLKVQKELEEKNYNI